MSTHLNLPNRILSHLRPLVGWQQMMLAVIPFLLFIVVAQFPFAYRFTVGKQRGYHSDAPFLQNVHKGESQGQPERWRWTRSTFGLNMPGVGERGVVVQMDVVSHRAQWQPDAPPTTLTIRPLATEKEFSFQLRKPRSTYRFYLPQEALPNGELHIEVKTDTWQNAGDRREDLGVALGGEVVVTSIEPKGGVFTFPTLPDLAMLLYWPVGMAVLWSAARIIGFSPNQSLFLVAPLSAIIPLTTAIQAPRVGFGSEWFGQMAVLSIVTAVIVAWAVPPLLRKLHVAPPPAILRWLLLLIALSFVLKYGGRLYPESMPGDLQLHVNRSIQTMQGRVYIEAQHRGLPFPFPNGPYLLVWPLTLLPIVDLRSLLQITLGIYEAVAVLALYVLVANATQRARLGLIAAAVYGLTAGGFMNTWFCFHTQVAAQAFSIILLAVLVVRWPRYDHPPTWWSLTTLFFLVYLGHIGLLLNTSLVGLLLIPVLWLFHDPQTPERRSTWALVAIGGAVAAGVWLFYLSAFWDLIVEQVTGVVAGGAGGLNEVTERPPIPREETLHVLWEGGFITHFGFFPVLLALPGVLLLTRRFGQHVSALTTKPVVKPLILLTFVVSVSQAILPLITLNSITTRWLMFSAWAVAFTAAIAWDRLWDRGRAARVVSLAMGAYVCWVTLVVYLEALALREPPIEPF